MLSNLLTGSLIKRRGWDIVVSKKFDLVEVKMMNIAEGPTSLLSE